MDKKILFINQEIAPYVPETELSLMGRDLPSKIQEGGCEIRTFMPKWGNINERRGQLHEVIRLSGINLIINETDHPLMTEDEAGMEYADNGERAIFFARGVLETVKKQRWAPDIIHCQGWMSAVVPLYIKTAYSEEPCFANSKVVTSLFTNELKQTLGENFKHSVSYRDTTEELLKPYKKNFDFMDLGKLAIDYSDGIVEAAPEINEQLLKHATKKKKPLLRYPGEDFAQAYTDFYESLF